jgi:anti-sigma factor (TIGR02949 family)
MSCELVERQLDAYFDRELSAESSVVVRDHLDKCAACRDRLAVLSAVAMLVRAAPFYAAPDRLRARVLGRGGRSSRQVT